MLLLALFVIAFFSFYREILFVIIRWILKAYPAELGTWDISLRAQVRSTPQILLSSTAFVETLILQTFWGSYAFVHEDLWKILNDDEKACFLAWAASASLRATPLQRIFFMAKMESLDRDVCLIATHPLSLSSLLKKVIEFRLAHPPSNLGGWLAGLSFLGPSFFGDWPSHDERLKVIASYLAELTKSQ